MATYMGVDGRKRALRLCVIDDTLKQVALIERKEDCTPMLVGRSLSTELIRSAAQAATQHADLAPGDVMGIAIALEGVDPEKSADWLREIFAPIFPHTTIVPTSIPEITLVGGLGERLGILLRADDDSLAFGVNRIGETVTIGGWGHLIGDEGGGHWLGIQALQAVARATDQRSISTKLKAAILQHLGLTNPGQLRHWLGNGAVPKNDVIANLVPFIFDCADRGDEVASQLIERAASHLGAHYRAATLKLNMQSPSVVLDGRWLTSDSRLQEAVLKQLGLDRPPVCQHDPVTGAALLARLTSRQDVPVRP
jgi:N-acetylglucosamine kinase-like BadF-type ATPase